MSDQFVHLHVHTHYSFLDGVAKPRDIIARAKELGQPAVAITDHGNMCGAIDFYREGVEQDFKTILGSEFYIAPGSRFDKAAGKKKKKKKGEVNPEDKLRGDKNYFHILVLAKNNVGYQNLVRLSTLSYLEGFYYKPRIDLETLLQHKEGLIVSSACMGSRICQWLLKEKVLGAKFTREIEEYLLMMKEEFGPDFYLELMDHGIEYQRELAISLIYLANKYDIPLIATNDVHYTRPEGHATQDVALMIGTGSHIDKEGRFKFESEELYMKSRAELEEFCKTFPPEAYDNTVKIAEQCSYDFEFGKSYFPSVGMEDPFKFLRDKVFEHWWGDLAASIPVSEWQKYTERIEFELSVIHNMNFVEYFIIVWDFVAFAHRNNILTRARGSGGGSVVLWCLSVVDFDPIKYNLSFERFLNPDRVSNPDVDLDIPPAGRTKMIEYAREKYGLTHTVQIGTFGSMKAKMALQDVGRVLNIPIGHVNKVKDMFSDLEDSDEEIDYKDFLPFLEGKPPIYRHWLNQAAQLQGNIRQISQHPAGVVISHKDIDGFIPLWCKTGEQHSPASQFNMYVIEDLGLVKMDFLGASILAILQDCLANPDVGISDLKDIPLDDEATYDMLGQGLTTGVFQISGSGLTKYITDLKPRDFQTVVDAIAVYRPGPLKNNWHTEYSNIYNTPPEERGVYIKYLHPDLSEVLKDTYGLCLYQEQVMKIAQVIAGYTGGEADNLRRIVGKKKAAEFAAEKAKFIERANEKYPDGVGEDIFTALEGFARYGFNASHATAYGFVTYWTAYMKCHWPAQYLSTFMNHHMNKEDKIIAVMEECSRMGVSIIGPDINRSDVWGFSAVDGCISMGLASVKGVGNAACISIDKERKKKPFVLYDDFCERLPKRPITSATRQALLDVGAFSNLGDDSDLDVLDRYFREVELLRRPISGHPLMAMCGDVYRLPDDDESDDPLFECYSIADLLSMKAPTDMKASIVGRVASIRNHKCNNGSKMAFVKLEDDTGSVDLLVFEKMLNDNIHLIQGSLDTIKTITKLKNSKCKYPIDETIRDAKINKLKDRFFLFIRGKWQVDESRNGFIVTAVYTMEECRASIQDKIRNRNVFT